MENVSRLLMLGFSVILFAAAIAVTVTMYHQNHSFLKKIEDTNSYRVIMVGD